VPIGEHNVAQRKGRPPGEHGVAAPCVDGLVEHLEDLLQRRGRRLHGIEEEAQGLHRLEGHQEVQRERADSPQAGLSALHEPPARLRARFPTSRPTSRDAMVRASPGFPACYPRRMVTHMGDAGCEIP
jgi:hypothetical protein